jgi:hypothetical protein
MSPFKTILKSSLAPSIAIFACAIVMLLCSRLALGFLESQGALTYIYATSGSGTILEQMCEILTGTSVVALIAIGGIIGGMIAALYGSTGWRFARGFARGSREDGLRGGLQSSAQDGGEDGTQSSAQDSESAASASLALFPAPSPALIPQFLVFALWSLVALIVIIAVFALVFLGTISDVQLTSVTSKLGGGGSGGSSGSGLMLPLTLAMFWTLLLMGGAVVFAAVSTAQGARRKGFALTVFLVVATVAIGFLLVFLSVALFTRFNVLVVDYAALNTWLGISIAANLVVMLLGLAVSRLFAGQKRSAS